MNETMAQPIVKSGTVLTLLGGGPTHFRHAFQRLDDGVILVCADGGADAALAAGILPHAVIGDLDSITERTRAQIPPDRLHHVAEQDSTDFEKCLQRIEAPLIRAYGFSGGRLDHELAACTALLRYPHHRCILIGSEDLCFLAPLRFQIELPLGTRISLFPMGPVRGQSSGLKYAINGIDMAPDGRIGTSNEVTGPISLGFSRRAMLILLPVQHLPDVEAALLHSKLS